MIVHISLFYLKDSSAADQMVAALNEIPKQNTTITTSLVGRNWVTPPPAPGLPDFADVAQVITFAREEDAAAYAESPAHLHLRKTTDHLIQRVSAAEFVQEA